MQAAQRVANISEAEYLRLEREAETKSEYFDGEMFAMAGGTRSHSLIASNFLSELSRALKNKDCVAYNSDLRIKIEATGLLTYPDISVVCGQERFLDEMEDTLLNPLLIVEVLSPSTEAYDRGKKFEHYRQMPSCQEFLLVSQTEPRVEQFVRQSSGEWLLKEVSGMEGSVMLTSVDVRISLAEIFLKVQFVPRGLRAAI
jgi:Uma2 family endonuclease